MRSHRPLFTVIVSGYQNEPYLQQCLGSIASQTCHDFEAICYVEESTDNSLASCQEWSQRDTRFIVASGPKSGSGSATRNYGIDHAAGEYLVIIDGDDWIAPEMLEKLGAKLKETGPLDILSFAGTKVVDADEEKAAVIAQNRLSNFAEHDATPLQVFSGLEAFRRIHAKDNSCLRTEVWLNIYRISFLRENHLRQIENLTIEDLEWFPRVFFAARKVAYLNECFYFYRQNPNSMQHRQIAKCRYDLARHFQHLVTFIKTHSIPSDILSIWSNQWLWLFFNFVFYWSQTSNEEQKAILKIFFSAKPHMLFWRFLLRASWHRVAPLPLLWLSSKGWSFPTNFYFRKIYLPLDWRLRRRNDGE